MGLSRRQDVAMGRYDDITPEKLRAELLRFAELIQRMDREELLLRSSPRILRLLGELRQMLFAYEIRGARHLGGKDLPGPTDSEPSEAQAEERDGDSLRIVREALRREKELQEELERRLIDSQDDEKPD
jgi:hypothetical protein